ncbi:MAG: tRNA 4-thiouridine(8) synthase ThiI [Euryarchaeota archaeon]|nr:tRNA 4-thiouridine(8) synthase ThiI [Euryarchaeota archaeon]
MFIVRYGEIGLKGKNRARFEDALVRNIRAAMQRAGYETEIKKLRGRIMVYGPERAGEVLARVPGVVSYSWAEEMEYQEVENYLERVLNGYSPESFKVEAHRIDKNFYKTSPEINEELGAFIVDKFGWKVNLTNPELIIGIEIINGRAYVFLRSESGVGGLPVGTAGKLLLLISPGMDSVVAGFMMLRRGATLHALHFSQGPVGEEKVRRYVALLSDYSPEQVPLTVISHAEIFESVVDKLKAKHRPEWTCVMCKYTMLQEAGRIAERVGALGIVTGDSLGQVASQTLQNMRVESTGTALPIYRPLVGMDKVEIERIARKIGSFSIYLSEKEEECPFRPRHVITEATPQKFAGILSLLNP